MRVPHLLAFLAALTLCLAVPPAPAQTGGPGAETGGARHAHELLALSERQNYTDHALAIETATRALSLFRAAGDAEGTAHAYAYVARYHFAQSDLAEAANNYETALKVWRELGNAGQQAGVLVMLGFVEARRGEWQNAISCLTEAEGLTAGADDPALSGQIASGLGHIFNESGLPEKGLAQYQRALEFYRRTRETRDDVLTMLEIGSTHYLRGDYPEALATLRRVLAEVPAGSLDAAQCHYYLGRVYGSTGEYAAALEHLRATLPVYTRAGNLRDAADALAFIGRVYARQGRLGPARRHYVRALETFVRVSDPINQAAVYSALGRLELGAGNYAAAEDYLRRSIDVTENIRRVPTSRDLTAAFSASVYDRYESYVECLMRQHESQPTRGLDVRAFETSEMARARSLTELLRATQTSLGGPDPALARREKALRQALRAKEDFRVELLSGKYRTEELTALEADLARLEAEYAEVGESMRALDPAYGRMTRPATWDLGRIQKQVLDDDEAILLEYFLGAERSYVWAVTRDRVRSYELPGRARIEAAAEKAYASVSAPPAGADSGDEAGEALRELSRMVLSPLAPELEGKSRLIVVADGALNYIPFQALPPPAAGGEPAVAAYEVVNAPSASILGELREEAGRRQPAPRLLAAFGNPVFASNYDQRGGAESAALRAAEGGRRQLLTRGIELNRDSFDPASIQPLFYAGRELANLLDLTSGAETLVAAGFDATRERLLGTDLSQYAILHFATHGLLDPRRPENSGLVLSTVGPGGRDLDGFVGLRSIYELRAPVNLVVLSACRTALGRDVRGEGLLGLTRGFMHAGASSVVASLWKVDDEATAELMREFYANMLRGGATPAAALRAAQNSIRRRPEWRSPYYWAAFTLQGEYLHVIKPAPAAGRTAPYVSAAAGGVTLLVLCGWLYGRRRRARRA